MTMTVAEAISSRRATRKFTDQVPTDEVVDRVAFHALEAPSAFNSQMRELVVIRDPKVKQAIFEASKQRQFLDAPVIFVTVARYEASTDDAEEILGKERADWVRGYRENQDHAALREAAQKDAGILTGFLLLAAQAEGLATSPTTGWREDAVKEAIGLAGREDRGICLVVAAGYPDEEPTHPGRAVNRRIDDRY